MKVESDFDGGADVNGIVSIYTVFSEKDWCYHFWANDFHPYVDPKIINEYCDAISCKRALLEAASDGSPKSKESRRL